jgi:hypothetical protein
MRITEATINPAAAKTAKVTPSQAKSHPNKAAIIGLTKA